MFYPSLLLSIFFTMGVFITFSISLRYVIQLSMFMLKLTCRKTVFPLRKEVIQPLVLERLPCYDFTPVIGFTLGSIFLDQLRAPPTSMV